MIKATGGKVTIRSTVYNVTMFICVLPLSYFRNQYFSWFGLKTVMEIRVAPPSLSKHLQILTTWSFQFGHNEQRGLVITMGRHYQLIPIKHTSNNWTLLNLGLFPPGPKAVTALTVGRLLLHNEIIALHFPHDPSTRPLNRGIIKQ